MRDEREPRRTRSYDVSKHLTIQQAVQVLANASIRADAVERERDDMRESAVTYRSRYMEAVAAEDERVEWQNRCVAAEAERDAALAALARLTAAFPVPSSSPEEVRDA